MLSLTLFYRKGLPFLNEDRLIVISIYTNYFTLSYIYYYNHLRIKSRLNRKTPVAYRKLFELNA
ncbi:IS3 family transposase [Lentibacillus sp. JNUCC-1]|uniref:IS3 family transposase n=1 Tax=Lentibacillus sp. JNUCC-1 TaxID=2654513 RepID=UPI003FA53F66